MLSSVMTVDDERLRLQSPCREEAKRRGSAG